VADNQRDPRQLSIFAAVIALHMALVWMLLAATQPVVMRWPSSNLQLVFIGPTIVVPERLVRKSVQGPQRVTLNPEERSEERKLIRPPVDWAAELDRVARDSATAEASRKPLNFGFPLVSAESSSKAPEFGWSYAPTHRVESLRGGGLLVNLNDNCVLVFMPLPLFACALGKKPANGDLFKQLRDTSVTTR
jgi:hypothetical protein